MSEPIYTRSAPGNFTEKAEKHIPVIKISGTTVTVRVGVIAHPMEEAHYIEWITLIRGETEIARKNLSPGDEPVATFENIADTSGVKARERCNLHGVWESD